MRSNARLYLVLIGIFVTFSIVLYTNIDSGRDRNEQIQKAVEVGKLRNEMSMLQDELNRNRQQMKNMKNEIEDAEKRRKQLADKQIEKENEVYDVRAEAEKQSGRNVDRLEGDANHKAVDEEKVAEDHRAVAAVPGAGNKAGVVHAALKTTISSVSGSICSLTQNYTHANSTVQMLDVYDTLTFDNPDGGVWKQGWEIGYKAEEVENGPTLEVVVIPHSHCDPGWIKTFEQYYQDQTKHILDGMVKHLSDKKDMRFIYAEISFVELWWREQTDDVRAQVRRLLESGQLELVTGGWVMTDEANSNYHSTVAELFEGHEWIRNHIGGEFRPHSHWSIDPFGLSPTVPHLLSSANITDAVLQRVHYSVKKHLAKNKQLEFMWRQLWGGNGLTKKDVRTHVFPFYSYDIPHTCGPEPAVCCQFDFRRLPGGGETCPWNIPPVAISAGNVDKRSFMIYDQYRKKSQLYGTNILLVPLGDDFRYNNDFEWEQQYKNYKQLFEHMNNKKEWKVNARFGTLSDYFSLLGESLSKNNMELPTLTGDFFTYADRDDHYWSGYFTSRPFYKQMDRVLMHMVRAAEMADTMARIRGGGGDTQLFTSLVSARRALSLFQHHDGVTGTAKDAVVIDYGEKMLAALRDCEKILSTSLLSLLSQPKEHESLLMTDYMQNHDTLPQHRILNIGDSIVVFNSLGRPRNEPICVFVASEKAFIKGEKVTEQEILPVFRRNSGKFEFVQGEYELCFLTSQTALGVITVSIVEGETKKTKIISKVGFISGFDSTTLEGTTFTVDNSLVKATFDVSSGYVKSIQPNGGKEVDVNLHFIHYGVRPHKQMNNGGGDDLSGAYLFLPDGEAERLPETAQDVVIIEGDIVKRVLVCGPADLELEQTYEVVRGDPSVRISNQVDIRKKSNYELAMRLETSVASGDELYTDLNGLQMIRRRRMLSKLPLQAHFYPMPASAFIEDQSTRVSLLGSQALGVASLKTGEIEVMLDRRLNQDDGRGLFQGVLDNKRTLSRFALLVEPLKGSMPGAEAVRVGYHSALGHAISMQLHFPSIVMNSQGIEPSSVEGLKDNLPCDVHIVSLRTLAGATDYGGSRTTPARREAALVLHRPLFVCRSGLSPNTLCSNSNQISPKSIIAGVTEVRNISLTALYEYETLETVTLDAQDVRSVKLIW